MYSPTDLKEFAPPKTAADLRDLLAESIIEIRLGKMDIGEVEAGAVKAIAYFTVSEERGRDYPCYTDEEILSAVGIHSIEQTLEAENYWFVRLGEVCSEKDDRGVTLSLDELSKLTVPPDTAWTIGRQNPAFRRPEVEQWVFRAIFRAIERLLESQKFETDFGVVDAFYTFGRDPLLDTIRRKDEVGATHTTEISSLVSA